MRVVACFSCGTWAMVALPVGPAPRISALVAELPVAMRIRCRPATSPVVVDVRLRAPSWARHRERAVPRNASGAVTIGIAGCQHVRERDAATGGQPAALAHLCAGTWPEFRFAPAAARRETFVAKSCGKHRRYGCPTGGVPAFGSGEIVAREEHGCSAARARMNYPVPRLLAAAPTRHAHIVDLVWGLGVPAHAVRVAARLCEIIRIVSASIHR